ncbi:MAG: hypothetical protein H6581_15310 [Bacteroidia bacterium]|nr:hypothetical protein [Bacteroidia bacterium]
MRIILPGLMMIVLAVTGCQPACRYKPENDFHLKIQQTECRGICPAFVVEVDAIGKVKYRGEASAPRVGEWQKQLSRKSLKKVRNTMLEGHFWDYQAAYGEPGGELPAVILELTYRGQSHLVADYGKAPASLKALQARLLLLIGEEGFSRANL